MKLPFYRVTYTCRPAVVGTLEDIERAKADAVESGEMAIEEAATVEIGRMESGKLFAYFPVRFMAEIQAMQEADAAERFIAAFRLPQQIDRRKLMVERVDDNVAV